MQIKIMSDEVISVQPSCKDCITWSDTADIAVAAGESVELLVSFCLLTNYARSLGT
jgi:hypothetical protein